MYVIVQTFNTDLWYTYTKIYYPCDSLSGAGVTNNDAQ